MKIIRYIFYTFRANKIIKTFMRKKYIKYPKQKNNHIYTIFTNQNSFLSRQMISDLRDLKIYIFSILRSWNPRNFESFPSLKLIFPPGFSSIPLLLLPKQLTIKLLRAWRPINFPRFSHNEKLLFTLPFPFPRINLYNLDTKGIPEGFRNKGWKRNGKGKKRDREESIISSRW